MVTLHHMHKTNPFFSFWLSYWETIRSTVLFKNAAFASVVEISSNYFTFVATPERTIVLQKKLQHRRKT